MSLFIPCSYCGERKVGKYSQATWAWWRADNVRVAYRQKLCLDCFVTNIAPLEVATRDSEYLCPVCHTAADDQLDPTYLTVYIPSVGPLRLEMGTCAACAVEVRVRAQKGADLLDDRLKNLGAAAPSTYTPDEVWKALGIEPRG